MNKFIVIVFPDSKGAYEGRKALNDLNEEGSITLYSSIVIERKTDGSLSTKEKMSGSPRAAGIGALFGGLAGIFGGPIGIGIGAGAGALIGGVHDLFNLGASREFLESVSQSLSPGKTAVIAEVSEE